MALEENGRVVFVPAKDQELDAVYLAPELQQFGIVTEKVRLLTFDCFCTVSKFTFKMIGYFLKTIMYEDGCQ